jgi:Flp pilus assembly protein TadG
VILRRLITHIGGAAAVEFALTAPVFFAIVFGLIDSGLLLWTQLGLQHATELAARCASVNKTICADTMR